MIKVGQIYNIPYLGGKVAITWIRADKTEFFMVRNDGFFFVSKEFNLSNEAKLITEYPTWQEAVNRASVAIIMSFLIFVCLVVNSYCLC